MAKRKAVKIEKCEATSDGWQAIGTVTNPGQNTTDYKVTVFFTTSKATVIATAAADVTVKANKTGQWTAKAKFKGEDGMRCILRGVA